MTNMPHWMRWADLAVVAGGSTNWELCFPGVPATAIVIAENQRRIAEQLPNAGVVCNLGPFKGVGRHDIRNAVLGLIDDQPRRQAMMNAGRALVDGRGADRVAAALAVPSRVGDEVRPCSLSPTYARASLLTCENVRVIRPRYGLAPKHLPDVLGRRETVDIPRGTPLAWSDITDAAQKPSSRQGVE